MSYTLEDFTETLDRLPYGTVKDLHKVISAWGETGSHNAWNGGFLCQGTYKFYYITGWCDTTGWGCQDGIEIHESYDLPTGEDLVQRFHKNDLTIEWDSLPADLNLYLERINANRS